MTTLSKSTSTSRPLAILFGCAVVITMLLFFLDEGYYNFKWMSNVGNWIAFAVYVGVIFSFQLLFFKLLLKSYTGRAKTLLSAVGGAVLGFFIVILGIFTNW
jgi:hypothetical protein